METEYNYNELENLVKSFLEQNKTLDHIYVEGQGEVLVSSPHSVFQTRKGKYKAPEIGALKTALLIHKSTNCHFISKTKNNNDDPNFDKESNYKNTIKKLINDNKIRYILDFHSLSKKRKCEVNLGTNFKKNIKSNKPLYRALKKELKKQGFKTRIDFPFNGGKRTISGSLKTEFPHIWTIQVEINSNISGVEHSFVKHLKLIKILCNFVSKINTYQKIN
ncbi:MAG: N-formylglutamate amidohydrolase [Clostridia bacterium]|nr:N-formylglutamate amidohydrolase [Clostridia bacterium]